MFMSISKKDGDGPLAKQQMIWCLCLYSIYTSLILILHPPFSLPQSISVIFHPVIVARFISCLLSSPNLLSKLLFPIVHHFLLISSPFPPLVFSPFLATIHFNPYSSPLKTHHLFYQPLQFFSSYPLFVLSYFPIPFLLPCRLIPSRFLLVHLSFSCHIPSPHPSPGRPPVRRRVEGQWSHSRPPWENVWRSQVLTGTRAMPLDGWGTLTDGEKLRWGSQCVEMDDVWEVKSAQRVNHGIERWSEKGQRGFFQCHPVIPHTSSSPLHPHFISFPLSLSLTHPLFIFPLTDRYMHFSHSNSVTFMNVQRLQSEVRERERVCVKLK